MSMSVVPSNTTRQRSAKSCEHRSMAKPDVYRFPGAGGQTDVIVTLWSSTAKVVPAAENPLGPAGAHAWNSNDAEGNGDKRATTEFHLWSVVLKEQSKHLEADILRWSNFMTTLCPNSPAISASHPWRGNMKCIHDVEPASYAQAFQAMYEAHYGESAETIAQTVVTSVKAALKLLRVASHLGFSTGVNAALLRIQAVPWTAQEEASVAECINLLRVPVSEELAARLKSDMQSILLNRKAVRSTLVESWKQRLLEWRKALETYSTAAGTGTKAGRLEEPSCELRHRRGGGSSETTEALEALSEAVSNICNSMFGLFGNAATLGVGNTLIECLAEDQNFQQVLALTSSSTNPSCVEHPNLDMDTAISYEAVLLVLLRIMGALSEGEVVCREELRDNMVSKGLTAYASTDSRLNAESVRLHLCPKYDWECELSLASRKRKHMHSLDEEYETFLNTYKWRRSEIKEDLVTKMGVVLSTSKGRIPIAQLLQSLTSAETTDEYLDKLKMLTTVIATLQISLPHCMSASRVHPLKVPDGKPLKVPDAKPDQEDSEPV